MSALDPELHVLRSVARSVAGQKSGLETARFKLWASLDTGDHDEARRWAKAVRAAVLTLDDPALRAAAESALETIEIALGIRSRFSRGCSSAEKRTDADRNEQAAFVSCPDCDGFGYHQDDEERACSRCVGDGGWYDSDAINGYILEARRRLGGTD